MIDLQDKLKKRFDLIFKGDYQSGLLNEIVEEIKTTKENIQDGSQKWTEKDVVLITYGDSIKGNNVKPLNALKEFLDTYLKQKITFVHILPFFPYSSDDGFSVINYREVNPELGDWQDIKNLSEGHKLMFDLVVNHISRESEWFRNFLCGLKPGNSYFIEVDPKEDLSMVVRPRSLPLLTRVKTSEGVKHVWTTFSDDQIDLNFKNPELVVEMLRVFLFYLRNGARMIRLDAIAFLWKETGTNCLHLPETHEFVKILRDITDYLSKSLILLTETNVPNKENLSYFGDNDEAHMVYQFSLPPLLLNTLFTGNSKDLTQWAMTIPDMPADNTFFNFTASHDGIGVRPLEGLVPVEDFDQLINGLKNFGAKVSTKRNSDGSDSPYEINITYYDAMKGIHSGIDNRQNERFICSQTIMMAMKGIPAFYIHSLLGTHNDLAGVKQTGMNRSINRKKWDKDELFRLLNSDTEHKKIFQTLCNLIEIRQSNQSFHPDCDQRTIEAGNSLFCIARDNYNLISISNITSTEKEIDISLIPFRSEEYTDIISKVKLTVTKPFILKAYQTIWLVSCQP